LAEEVHVPKWSTIKIPGELRVRLWRIARKEGRGMWRVINDALDFYELHKPRSKEEFKVWEGAGRYIVRLAFHAGLLKARPSEENLEQLRKVCRQLEEELGVKTEQLVKAAEAYAREPSEDNAAELISAAKIAAIEILYSYHELMRKRGGELGVERREERERWEERGTLANRGAAGLAPCWSDVGSTLVVC